MSASSSVSTSLCLTVNLIEYHIAMTSLTARYFNFKSKYKIINPRAATGVFIFF